MEYRILDDSEELTQRLGFRENSLGETERRPFSFFLSKGFSVSIFLILAVTTFWRCSNPVMVFPSIWSVWIWRQVARSSFSSLEVTFEMRLFFILVIWSNRLFFHLWYKRCKMDALMCALLWRAVVFDIRYTLENYFFSVEWRLLLHFWNFWRFF